MKRTKHTKIALAILLSTANHVLSSIQDLFTTSDRKHFEMRSVE